MDWVNIACFGDIVLAADVVIVVLYDKRLF